MDFVASQDFATPLVRATGQPHRPTEIKKIKFRKGDIITGEIKTAKGKPAFVLHKGCIMVPLTCVKQLITKDINGVSSAEGAKKVINADNPKVDVKVKANADDKKKKLADGFILGAILGFGGMLLAEKQGIVKEPNNKNRLYAAAVGAALGVYYIYRFKK